MSDEAFRVSSRIRYCGNPARGLWAAVGADEIAPDDLPPIIADLWTYNDSPTADLHEEAWVEGIQSCRILFISAASTNWRRTTGSVRASRPSHDTVSGEYRGPDAPYVMGMRL